mgnify:CR=1 FL=1
MGLAFIVCSWCARFFGATLIFTELMQVNAAGQIQQQRTQKRSVSLSESCPFLILNGDIESLGGVGDFGGQVVLRDAVIDVSVGMRDAQRGHDHGLEIEGHEGEAEAKQGGLRVAEGVEFGIQIGLDFLKRGLDGPAGAVQRRHGWGRGDFGGSVVKSARIRSPLRVGVCRFTTIRRPLQRRCPSSL